MHITLYALFFVGAAILGEAQNQKDPDPCEVTIKTWSGVGCTGNSQVNTISVETDDPCFNFDGKCLSDFTSTNTPEAVTYSSPGCSGSSVGFRKISDTVGVTFASVRLNCALGTPKVYPP